LACALVAQPDILFLDEPTTGLDPQARRQVWDIVGAFRRGGGTTLLTTHYMEEAQQLCDRVAIVDYGKVIALGTPDELIASLGAEDVVEFALEDEEGLTLKLCESGQAVLDSVAEFAPDLILLDVMMPGMDGPTTLQRLHEMPDLGETPVVFVTAKVQPHEVEQFKALGAVDVIAKPFDPMSLAKQVRAAWERSSISV